MDWILVYICIVYLFVLAACVLGAFNMTFNANVVQRVALFLLAVWAVWRFRLVLAYGWAYPHEPLVVTALGLYAAGTVLQTWTRRRS